MHFMIDETLQCRVWGETRTKSEERVRVTSQTTLVVENVRRYFTPQKLKGHTHGGVKVMKRTADAMGLSLTNMKRVHSEYLAQDGEFFSPMKRYMVSRIRVNRLLWSSGHQEGCVRVLRREGIPNSVCHPEEGQRRHPVSWREVLYVEGVKGGTEDDTFLDNHT